jgi:HD-GYP domain-containing protein (c-di-GMP phosphodiesterase class II)
MCDPADAATKARSDPSWRAQRFGKRCEGDDMTEELKIRRKTDPLDRVEKRSAVVELLASAGSIEVTRHEIEAGRHIWLYASDEWSGFELVYILQGTIALEGRKGDPVTLGAGDYLYHYGLPEKEYFRAETRIEILLISNSPSFHLMRNELEGMMSLVLSVDEKDSATEGHCTRIERLAILTGERLGLMGQELIDLSYAAYLHDIGKVKVPDEILGKGGELTNAEWSEMKRHPDYGAEILKEKTFLGGAAAIVRAHHERFDGTGYPRGLEGEEIPIGACVVAVVDTYDAMTSVRPYQRAQAKREAIEELQQGAGTQFDPRVVRAFIEVIGGDGEE